MNRIKLLISVVLGCFCLIPATKVLGQANPSTWNSFVMTAGAQGIYDSSRPAVSDVVSRFTPAKPIEVTRIEAQAAQGSQIYAYSPEFHQAPCTDPITLKISDGTRSQALHLSSAGIVVTGGLNPSSADSGRMDLVFPAGAKIELSVGLGDLPSPDGSDGGCVAGYINVTVQYAVLEGGQNQQ